MLQAREVPKRRGLLQGGENSILHLSRTVSGAIEMYETDPESDRKSASVVTIQPKEITVH